MDEPDAAIEAGPDPRPAMTELADVPQPPAKKTRGPNKIQKETISVKYYSAGKKSHTTTNVVVADRSADTGGVSSHASASSASHPTKTPTGGAAASRAGQKRSAPAAEQDDIVQTHEDVLETYKMQLNDIPGGKPRTDAAVTHKLF